MAARETIATIKGELERSCILANAEADYWSCFTLLRKKLGAETYRASIRRAFQGADRKQVPEIYRHLWRLQISGMITLNIDQFATRAYAEVNETGLLHDFTGSNIASYLYILRSNTPWLANLHGILPDSSSWIFTRQDLNNLFQNVGYDQFIKACFASRTVVFIGCIPV
jgi:hypothetical protein